MNQSFYGFGPSDDSARAYRPGGLPGATAAMRLAGATASGAPTAGAFRKGDLLVGQDGTLRICSASGIPGTWVQLGTLVDPLSTRGDLIVRGASATTRLALGSANQVLTSDGTDALWAVSPASAGGALTKVAETILGSSAASITFSSISGSYRNLIVSGTVRGDGTAEPLVLLRLNGDSAGNYAWSNVRLSGTGVTGLRSTSDTSMQLGFCPSSNATNTSTTSEPGSFRVTLYDYARTTWLKDTTGLMFMNDPANTNQYLFTLGGRWNSTAAVTSLTVLPNSGSLVSGSVVTLWAEG